MSELAVGYIRVSTEDQTQHSPWTQYNRILEYFNGKKWNFRQERLQEVEIELDDRITDYTIDNDEGKKIELSGIFSESGSGWTPDTRPTFEELLRYVSNNKEVKHVVFVWVNRMNFPQFRGHTEEFDIISSLEVCYGRTKRS